jgi:hypothetical protein
MYGLATYSLGVWGKLPQNPIKIKNLASSFLQIQGQVMIMKMKIKNCNEYSFLRLMNNKLSSITLYFNEVSNNVHFFYRFADVRIFSEFLQVGGS